MANKIQKAGIIFLVFISFVVSVFSIYTSPIHTDEGWYHHCAKAKNHLGFYTSPAFYDVPPFQDFDYISPTRLIIQFYRVFDLFFEAKDIIIAVRFLVLFIFSSAVFLYIHSLKIQRNTKNFNLLLAAIVIFYPFVLKYYNIAREELFISSIFLFVLAILRSDLNTYRKNQIIIALITAAYLFHPNGIVLFGIIGILKLDRKKPLKIILFLLSAIFLGFFYYLVFIDPNLPKFTEQFKLMYFSGSTEKFLSSPRSFISYFIAEFEIRYINWPERKLISYPVHLLLLILPIAIGVVRLIKDKTYKPELIFVSITLVFLFFVGNKYQGYLLYFFPVLLIITIHSFFKNGKIITAIFIAILIIGNIYQVRHLFWNKQQNEMTGNIVASVYHNVPAHGIIYASFGLEPYLYPTYKYLTTTQKGGNGFYDTFRINPKSCFIIAEDDAMILKYIQHKVTAIDKIGDNYLYFVEQ